MTAGQLLRWPVDVLVRPSDFVRVDPDQEPANRVDAIIDAVRLVAVYFANLLLYTAPLALAGYGVRNSTTAPPAVSTVLEPIVGNPDTVWQFGTALLANGIFLLLATVLTLVTFHIGTVLAGSSNGIVQSLRAVSYSTGIYLAVMFSIVVSVSTESGFKTAEGLLLWLQASFIQFFIDFVGADLVPPVEASRPELSAIATVEQALLTVLLLSGMYFLYVLYAGARTSHDATRIQALCATAFVLASPALYVLGAIYLTIGV
ncbi:hypothetical protein [Halopiger aswanensis]|uniref:Yip1-like protein n=1 Tax=Halopiger aswanensis TaxID=148449 RepID=A0A3R7GGU1_9EURY|nr:hypothetical protein [Halopiger aswanensis]RKD93559.1 hypothetical protein ATJ93_3189 [Halopiger aswanensis]